MGVEMNDEEIKRLIELEKVYNGGSIKWKSQRRSTRCDCIIHSSEIDGYFILYARQNEIDVDNYSCGIKLVSSGKDDITLLRCNGSGHAHTNTIEREDIDFECHIHIATERYAKSGYKIDHFAVKTDNYNNLQGAIEHLILRCNIKGLTTSEFMTQEGFSFD